MAGKFTTMLMLACVLAATMMPGAFADRMLLTSNSCQQVNGGFISVIGLPGVCVQGNTVNVPVTLTNVGTVCNQATCCILDGIDVSVLNLIGGLGLSKCN